MNTNKHHQSATTGSTYSSFSNPDDATTVIGLDWQPRDRSAFAPCVNDLEAQEAAIARCTADAIRQFHTQPNPFAWSNHQTLAINPATKYTNPELTDAVRSYYHMLADCFQHMPLTLPPIVQRGADYRQQCFHAWLGRAVLKILNISLDGNV